MPKIIWKIQSLPRCSSTNAELKRLLIQGEADFGHVLTTEHQTQGRGRLSRQWLSPQGNIAMSLACPLLAPQERLYQLNLVTGLSLARAIRQFADLNTKLKWPNDVLLDGLKVSGVLSEALPENGAVIIGIGINFNSTLQDFPQDLRQSLTTLKDRSSKELDGQDFIEDFLDEIKNDLNRYERNGLASLLPEMNELLAYRQQRVEISESESETYEALITGLSDEGWLTVRADDGSVKNIVAGDVRLVAK